VEECDLIEGLLDWAAPQKSSIIFVGWALLPVDLTLVKKRRARVPILQENELPLILELKHEHRCDASHVY